MNGTFLAISDRSHYKTILGGPMTNFYCKPVALNLLFKALNLVQNALQQLYQVVQDCFGRELNDLRYLKSICRKLPELTSCQGSCKAIVSYNKSSLHFWSYNWNDWAHWKGFGYFFSPCLRKCALWHLTDVPKVQSPCGPQKLRQTIEEWNSQLQFISYSWWVWVRF